MPSIIESTIIYSAFLLLHTAKTSYYCSSTQVGEVALQRHPSENEHTKPNATTISRFASHEKHASHITGRQQLKLALTNASILHVETHSGSVYLRVDGWVCAIAPNEFRMLASPTHAAEKPGSKTKRSGPYRRSVRRKQPPAGSPEERSRHAYAAATSRQHIPQVDVRTCMNNCREMPHHASPSSSLSPSKSSWNQYTAGPAMASSKHPPPTPNQAIRVGICLTRGRAARLHRAEQREGWVP